MRYGYPTKLIHEGKVELIVPELDETSRIPIQQLRSNAPVFYNPQMKTNRDTAVLVTRAYQSEVNRPILICEPMAGCGVRGIRLLLETHDIDSIVLGDLNPTALELAQENAIINGVNNLINFRELDANLLMSLHSYPSGRFDYIDIDPYGTPIPFINTAINAIKNHGIIALTATDMAPLCGVNKRACLRKYGSWPLKSEFCHETAIRIMTAAMVRHSAIYEYAATLVFGYYLDHYIRGYYKIQKGARRADRKLKDIGYIKYCPICLTRETSQDNHTITCKCGKRMQIGGPLWLGELSDLSFLNKIIEDIEHLDYMRGTRVDKLAKIIIGEHGFPVGFYDIDKICKVAGVKSISTNKVKNKLIKSGYLFTKVHYSPRGFKTNADISELVKIFQGFK
jgi:tRNA (guanine26-N2/guanine27-N2)-dimethyltransferase